MGSQTAPLPKQVNLKGTVPEALRAALVVAALALACLAGTLMQPSPAYALEGTGVQGDPYRITTVTDLKEFAAKVNAGEKDAHAQLIANIDLNPNITFTEDGTPSGPAEQWTPIADYQGVFDGNNCVIKGLYIKNDQKAQGLFGKLSGGTIKNLGIENSYVQGGRTVGAVCADNAGGTIDTCYNAGTVVSLSDDDVLPAIAGGVCATTTGNVVNCENAGSVTANNSLPNISAITGGVCGLSAGGSIQGCTNSGTITSTSDGSASAGGVCGNGVRSKTIDACTNTGEVSASSQASVAYAGGVYSTDDGSPVTNCVNSGKVSASSYASDALAGGVCSTAKGAVEACNNSGEVLAVSVKGYAIVGGVCGESSGSITTCCNTGGVSALLNKDAVIAGGVCGRLEGSIEDCSNSGTVAGQSSGQYVSAGGICGNNAPANGSIARCSNSGEVYAIASSSASAGGVCGVDYARPITNCYNTGKVYAKTDDVGAYAGGVCGGSVDNAGHDTIENCYNIGEVSLGSDGPSSNADGVCADTSTVTLVNCYYLDSSVSGAKAASDATAKTSEQFASGEVAWLLDRGSSAFDPANLVWGQKIGSDVFPLFIAQDKSNAVYQVSYDTSTLPEIAAVPAQYGNAGSTITLTPVDGVKWLYDAGDGPQAVAQIILSADTQVQAASTSVVPKPEQDPEKKPTTNNTTNNTTSNATRLAATGDAVPTSALAALLFAALAVSGVALGALRFNRKQ